MNFGYKEIIKFIGIFFFCYLIFFLGFKQETIKKSSLVLIHSLSNTMANQFYDQTLVKVIPMIQGNSNIFYEGKKLTINNSDYNPEFDTRIIMINEKLLKAQINGTLSSDNSPQDIQIHSFKFSIWNFILLPLTILVSLIIAHTFIFKFSMKANIYAISLTLSLIFIQTAIVLTNFRSQALHLEKFELNETITSFLSKLHNLFQIEFTLVTVMIVYLLVFWKQIFSSIYKAQVAE